MLYVPLLTVGWIPWSIDNNMGMKYQVQIYFGDIGKILDSPPPDIFLQDAEMMNLDLD